MSVTSRTIILKNNLNEGLPGPEHFHIEDSSLNIDEMKKMLTNDSVLVQLLVISADPYLRGTIRTDYAHSVQAGHPMKGFVAGKVIASINPHWKEGDLFGANLPFTTYQVVSAEVIEHGFRKLTNLVNENEISLGIGILGMPGSTSYGGLCGVLRPKEGETIFISAAAGAVGGVVGMIAKQVFHCTVIGSCGGEDKCAFIKEKYGFDHAIDYKTAHTKEELVQRLKEVAPQGIDMYFENVGGIHFEAAFEVLRPLGRIAVCGTISTYNAKAPVLCSIDPFQLVYNQQRIEGFVCHRWLHGQEGNFLQDMSQWLQEGKVHVQETVFEGIEKWPEAFQSLFLGKNFGKVVVKV
jgi:NADPH-dependent curcumin reductase CurA